MTYTITSARWANEDQAAFVAQTEEAGAVAGEVNGRLHAELLASGVTVAVYVAPSQVPIGVMPLQARRALRAAGLLATVDAWVAGQDDDDIKDAWQFASVIERAGPITLGAAQALGLTDAQLDALFVAAAGYR